MRTKALLITEEDFDEMIASNKVDIIGSYCDLRENDKRSNPYLEYVISPIYLPENSDKKYKIESVIISSENISPKIIDYPR